jgi:SAM-dependent methyltransferase
MTTPDAVTRRYLDGSYAAHNPTWDREDSPWKAAQVLEVLGAGLRPRRIAEVGCGAGNVLLELAAALPEAQLSGYDISPDAEPFWRQNSNPRVRFARADFLAEAAERYDLVLVLDVIEHVANPHSFLERIRARADHFVFHFPLDLSALTVLREAPLLHAREKVGHLHYYTRGLVLALLEECGLEVVRWRYTGAGLHAPHRSLRSRLAALPRALLSLVSRDLSARLLGGETLMVLARPR